MSLASTLNRIPRTTGPLGVVTVTAVFYAIAIVVRLAWHDFNPSFFVIAGENFCQPKEVPEGLLVNPGDGYDGQFYYRLALQPIARNRTEFGITLDNQPYREQRILYPALVHVVSFGRASWVPWSMILVNYLAVCLLAFSAARLAESFGVPAFYGLMVPFYPGALLALERDLADPLAVALMVSSLCLHCYRKVFFAGVILALAVLTRESVALLAGGLFVVSVWRAIRRHSGWKEIIPWMIPLATYLGWQLRIYSKWGTMTGWAVLSRVNPVFVALPFSGYIPTVIKALRLATSLHPLLLTELLFLAGLAIVAGVAIVQSSVDLGVKVAWLTNLVMTTMFSQIEWVEDWAFLRGAGELMVLSLVILIGARNRRLLQMTFWSVLAIWAALAYQRVIPL